jgi:hypothetical protein
MVSRRKADFSFFRPVALKAMLLEGWGELVVQKRAGEFANGATWFSVAGRGGVAWFCIY